MQQAPGIGWDKEKNMTVQAPFQGARGQNQVVTPNGTSASVSINNLNKSVRLVNSGANICYVRIGAGAQTATTADVPVRSAESLVLQRHPDDTTVAYISASATTLNIQPGEGGH